MVEWLEITSVGVNENGRGYSPKFKDEKYEYRIDDSEEYTYMLWFVWGLARADRPRDGSVQLCHIKLDCVSSDN